MFQNYLYSIVRVQNKNMKNQQHKNVDININ